MDQALLPIVYVEPHSLVRQVLTRHINTIGGFKVVGEAPSADEALRLVEKLRPKLLLLELSLPGPSGVELLQEIRRRGHTLPALVISSLDSEQLVACARKAGALGFLAKSEPLEQLAFALRTVARGEIYLPTHLKHILSEPVNYSFDMRSANDPLVSLSSREREIFHLLASGMQNSVIAKKLFISPRTVETHRARVVRKLGLGSNSELIRFAIRHGLSVV